MFINDYRKKLLESIGETKFEASISSVGWYTISLNTNLTQEFIREFSDKLNWSCISRTRTFSDDFIFEFKHRIDWLFSFSYNKIEFSTMKQFILKTNFQTTDEFNVTHLTSLQIQEIQKLLDFKNVFNK